MTDSAYQANHIKASRRDTRRGGTSRASLYDIVAAMYPITVPQVFYQATVHSIVEKTETGHGRVQTDLVWMRSSWTLPYDWLTDSTRWQRKPRSFLDPEDALLETA